MCNAGQRQANKDGTSMVQTALLARSPRATNVVLAVIAALTVGCAPDNMKPGSATPAVQNVPPAEADTAVTDQWLGQWNGPEGTYLRITGDKGIYAIAIRDLDTETTFHGIGVDDRIEFERKGLKESLHATNGATTGMKWLADKIQCLTVRTGEGYCRD